MNLIEIVLISMIPLPIFWVVFKIRLRFIPLGILAIIISALAELKIEELVNGEYIVLMVILLAPIVEETTKMFFTWFGKNTKSGMAVGLGFAILENILYYQSYPYMFAKLFMLREFQDPLLHSTATGISAGAWKKPWKYFIAIGLHMFYNIMALSNSVVIISSVALGYLVILLYIRQKERKKERNQNQS